MYCGRFKSFAVTWTNIVQMLALLTLPIIFIDHNNMTVAFQFTSQSSGRQRCVCVAWQSTMSAAQYHAYSIRFIVLHYSLFVPVFDWSSSHVHVMAPVFYMVEFIFIRHSFDALALLCYVLVDGNCKR